MNKNIIRFLFIGLCVVLAIYFSWQLLIDKDAVGSVIMGGSIGLLIGGAAVGLEIIISQRMSSFVPSILLGLILGVLSTWVFNNLILLSPDYAKWASDKGNAHHLLILSIGFTFVFTYFWSSFVIQTRDTFKISIPYVEFKRQGRGVRPLVFDTSSLIDGRIVDLASTHLMDMPLIIPSCVYLELQRLADNSEKFVRQRGRRGLDMAKKLSQVREVRIDETVYDHDMPVDQRLLRLTRQLDGILVTTDYNLTQVAALESIDHINLNEAAIAFKSIHLPGDTLEIAIMKPGEEAAQGVGYLEDGTMVVVDKGRDKVGESVVTTVTSNLQTTVGRMIFARIND